MISGFLKFHFCCRMRAPRTDIGSYLSSHNYNLAEEQDGSETRASMNGEKEFVTNLGGK